MNTKFTERQNRIIEIVNNNQQISISEIKIILNEEVSQITLNRDLALLVKAKVFIKEGKARAIRYSISENYKFFEEIELDSYFDKEPDERDSFSNFNFDLFQMFENITVFNKDEVALLEDLKTEYQNKIETISPTLYKKEMERLSIELSWKSSQIEGNTYSLLETERLFLERESAKNKTKEEAIMLLNHKYTLEYLLENTDIANQLSLRVIEEVHSLLITDLDVGKNIRKRAVGITGTVYKPLDNEFQITEHLKKMCKIINAKENGFEKAFLAIILISYIQPFEDGNKRTGRMMGNALLINYTACPLSYRSVSSIEYKKAILLFYEQNNISAFKKIFIDQFEFAVNTYF